MSMVSTGDASTSLCLQAEQKGLVKEKEEDRISVELLGTD
jgi:hypothetical protein